MVTGRKVKTKPRPPFWYRKLSKAGGTRTLVIGYILPPDWLMVRVRVVKMEGKTCVLELTKID